MSSTRHLVFIVSFDSVGKRSRSAKVERRDAPALVESRNEGRCVPFEAKKKEADGGASFLATGPRSILFSRELSGRRDSVSPWSASVFPPFFSRFQFALLLAALFLRETRLCAKP